MTEYLFARLTDLSNYQPLDSDLTAIAALTTTSYGRGLLTLANSTALAAETTVLANTWSALQTFSLAGNTARFVNTTDSASVQVIRIEGDRATMADSDEAYVSFMLSNDAGAQTEFARLTWVATDVNAGTSEDGAMLFGVMTAGTMTNHVRLSSNDLRPVVNDSHALGSATISWSDLYLASGAVINYANGNVTITHGANSLTADGAALIWNEAGADLDVRIEGDTEPNLFFLDASVDTAVFGYNVGAATFINNTTRPLAQIHHSSARAGLGIARYSADTGGSNLILAKSRHATTGSHTIVQSGDTLGVIRFEGSNGTGFDAAAQIYAVCAATPGATDDMPGYLAFATSADGSASPTVRAYLTSDGTLMAVGTGTFDPTVAAQTKPNADVVISANGSGANASVASIVYGTGVNPAMRGFRARGTAASPTATQAEDTLLGVVGLGYQTTTGAWATAGNAGMFIRAKEAFTSTAQGSYIAFETTPTASTTRSERMRIEANGNVGVGGSPSVLFDVLGIIGVSNTAAMDITTNYLRIYEPAGGAAMLLGNASDQANYYQNTSHYFRNRGGGTIYAGINTSGQMAIATTGVPIAFNAATPSFQVLGASTGPSQMGVAKFAADNTGPNMILAKSRNATISTHTIVQNADVLGAIVFQGSNGSAFNDAAYIVCTCGGTPGASADMPGQLNFYVSADGSATPTARAVMFSTGGINVGSPTGGDKGAGTLNATAVYDDNVLLTCLPVQKEFLDAGTIDRTYWNTLSPPKAMDWAPDGKVIKEAPVPHPSIKIMDDLMAAGYDPRNPKKYCDYLYANNTLPGMPSRADWVHNSLSIGQVLTRLWLACELLAVSYRTTCAELVALKAQVAGTPKV